jgi:DNA sulfur modification protein DndD
MVEGLDQYILTRQWVLDDSITESFSIDKNGVSLEREEVADFEKYLLSLIPPELFNLYFFDGEKIADFFLDEGSNTRIKEAFLTLCGYDTFDIMRKNFKRICASGNSQKETLLSAYIAARESDATEKDNLDKAKQKLSECITAIENCDYEITALERDYSNKGGITEEEWNQKLVLLKEEETQT